MASDAPEPGSVQDWLRHARSDLALAGVRKTRRVLYEHLCFHAQQAAEKAIKSVLVSAGIRIPRTHDLAFLLAMLPEAVSVAPSLIELPTLTKYAVQQRYPGETAPLTAKHVRLALQLAQEAVAWATRVTRSR